MKQYIGTKIVQAEPAVRIMDSEFNMRVVALTEHPITHPDDTVDLGYKVRYEDGYESFSPQDVFEKAYRESDGLPFGLAIEAAQKGKRIARKGWNGKNMYVFFVPGETVEFSTDADIGELGSEEITVQDLLVMRTAQRTLQPGWLASQADMLADDWYIVE